MEKIPIRYINVPQKDLDLSEIFSIREVQDFCTGQDMIQGLHRHDFFFILVLKNGTGDHVIDFIPYQVQDHSIFLMHPGQVHRLTLSAGSSGYIMQFKADFFYPDNKESSLLLRKASNNNFCHPDPKGFKKLFAVLTDIFQEYSEKQEGYHEVIKAYLRIFFLELVRQRKNKQNRSNTATSYSQERLDEFLGLLETHSADCKQVSQYADMLNLSQYQLNSITKELLGKTCSEVINEHLVLESKRYLLATSNQINQIAYHLGYDDVSYFIRFFKKHTGHSPDAFRQNFR